MQRCWTTRTNFIILLIFMSTFDFGKVSKEMFVENLENGFFLLLNIQSIRSHHDQLAAFVASFESQPIALCLCETWLSDTDCLSLYKLPIYRPIIARTRESQRVGGCAIFVHDSLKYKIVNYGTEVVSSKLSAMVCGDFNVGVLKNS